MIKMCAHGLFRAARVQSCLLLLFLLGVVPVFAGDQVNCSEMALPQNAAPFLPRSTVLLNMLDQVDPDRLMKTIDDLQNMVTRHVLSSQHSPDAGIGAAARYITAAFKLIDPESRHLIVTTQEFYTKWGNATLRLENIIAIIPGSQPDLGVVVVGAHYDSRGVDLNDGSAPAPGADDNGSGIAALIELARILNASRPRLTIMLVAFSAEEIGRRGSIHFVRDYLQAQQIPVSVMINLDVIGGSGQYGVSVDSDRIRLFSPSPDDSASRSLARTIQFIAGQYVPTMAIAVQNRADRVGRFGDQQSFTDEGYQAVRFTEAIEDVSRQDNALDTIDRIQADYLERSTQTVLAAVKVLADGPRAPQSLALADNVENRRNLTWGVVSDAASYIVALRSPDSLVYDQQFEVIGTNVAWTGFGILCTEVLAIAAKDADGLMGPLSDEYYTNISYG